MAAGVGAGSSAGRTARTAGAIALGLLALLGVHALTVALSGAGLHVDEAQYWDWSRTLQWGYWSKPPGVAALIAASTALFGDGVLGLRLLGMACWPAAAGVMAALAGSMAGRRAALWTAAIFAVTPASGLLGLVVTTDGPLMLCWSLTLAAAWRALQAEAAGRPAWGAWAATGLAAGLGLLAKYTLAALLLSLPPLLWQAWRQRARRPAAWPRLLAGLMLAVGVAGLLLLPNLWWNARHGWPTLTHTAAITAQAAPVAGRSPAASLAEFVASQLLLLGPAALALGLLVLRRARTASPASGAHGGEGFALAAALPLLGLGALQAWNAKAQMNWTAPALAGLSLWLGLRAARSGLGRRAWLASTAGGLAITTALALAGTLLPALAGRGADVWARMRGWDETLAALRPALLAQPGLPLAAAERDLLVQAAYAWRDLPRRPLAWPPAAAPQHHYEQFHPLVTAGDRWPEAVLLLCSDAPPAALRARYRHWQRLDQARARSGRQLALWRGDGPVPDRLPDGRAPR